MIDRIAVLGLLAGMAALWVWDWQIFRILERHEKKLQEYGRLVHGKAETEQRCGNCKERKGCPPYTLDAAPSYPCPRFRKED